MFLARILHFSVNDDAPLLAEVIYHLNDNLEQITINTQIKSLGNGDKYSV